MTDRAHDPQSANEARALLLFIDAVSWHVDGLRTRVVELEDLIGSLLTGALDEGLTTREKFHATLGRWRAGLAVDAAVEPAPSSPTVADDPLRVLRARLEAIIAEREAPEGA